MAIAKVMHFRHQEIEWAVSGLSLEGTCHITTALELAVRFACCANIPATNALACLCLERAPNNLISLLHRASQQDSSVLTAHCRHPAWRLSRRKPAARMARTQKTHKTPRPDVDRRGGNEVLAATTLCQMIAGHLANTGCRDDHKQPRSQLRTKVIQTCMFRGMRNNARIEGYLASLILSVSTMCCLKFIAP